MTARFERLCSNGKVRNALFWKNLTQLYGEGLSGRDWLQLVKTLEDQHPVSRLIPFAGHYLWNSIYQLNESLFSELTVNRFKLALVDCFANLFPDDTCIRIKNWHLPLVSFPSLGLQVETTSPDFSITIKEGTIQVSVRSKELHCLPNKYSVHLDAGQGICMIDNGTWFDPPLLDKMESMRGLIKMKGIIEDALALISATTPRLHKRITNDIRSYVLVKAEVANAHHSFTTQSYPNAIFLSKDEKRLTIAEAIVHEFSHNELESILAFEPIHSGDETCEYYSPWRNDIRPLKGLFHAVYVFNRVLSFYYSLDLRKLTEVEQQTVAYKKNQIFHKLQIGLWQIPSAILEPTALAIYHSINTKMKRLKQLRKEQLIEPVREQLINHITRWREKHYPVKPVNELKIKNLLYAPI